MGGSASTPSAPKVDYNAATFSSSYVNELQQQAAAAIKQTQAADASKYWGTMKLIAIWLIVIVVLLVAYDLLVAYVFPTSWDLPHVVFDPVSGSVPYTGTQKGQELTIISATWDGTPTTGTPTSADVSAVLIGMISSDFKQIPSFTVSSATLQQPANAAGFTYALNVKYRIGAAAIVTVPPVADGSSFPQLGSSVASSKPPVSGVQKTPPALSKVWGSLFGQGSSNLIGKAHNSETSTTIRASSAPISDTKDGSYGIQYWMFIRDWNYGYGKDKAVLTRADPTNGAIMNPSISLHPTDNSLKIAVSIFPSSPGSQKTEPAPAGHSGATDDIDSVTIPDIPLQTWFSVSMTVFGRNLDVYIDGKLVTSKLLSGVPKPAVGDIQLTPAGGFSGYLCGFYHYPRMLTPGDAMTFYSSGTPCAGITAQSGLSQATGYSVKFGLYDSIGKEVTEYSF